MLYEKIIKKILFFFEPEIAHKLALGSLKFLDKLGLVKLFANFNQNQSVQTTICNLYFKNKLGIAAGLDKDGSYISALASLGVGFVELGTVTPRPQRGNPKPRLFRLPKEQAIINRMGFNNKGVENLVENVRKFKQSQNADGIVIAINIGKNFDTAIEDAVDDYLIGLEKTYEIADFITVNISSPNTKSLRDLQSKDKLIDLLSALKLKQEGLSIKHQKYTPLAVKIAPDLSDAEIKVICELCFDYKIDIIIATNTTIDDKLLYDNTGSKIAGGLSGKPLLTKSNYVLSKVIEYTKLSNNNSGHKIAVIGVGGISSVEDAKHKINLGADLVQVYSGLIYKGPGLINEIINNME